MDKEEKTRIEKTRKKEIRGEPKRTGRRKVRKRQKSISASNSKALGICMF